MSSDSKEGIVQCSYNLSCMVYKMVQGMFVSFSRKYAEVIAQTEDNNEYLRRCIAKVKDEVRRCTRCDGLTAEVVNPAGLHRSNA